MANVIRRILAGGAVIACAAGAGAATGAWASIPASDGSIHACYKTADLGQGQLYVIDSAANCSTGYTELDWNQSGISGYQVYTGTQVLNGPLSAGSASATITCPGGKKVLGAGRSSDVTADQPTSDGTGWMYTFTIPQIGPGGAYNFRSTVICATVGS